MKFTAIQTVILLIIFLILGYTIKNKTSCLKKYYIPAPLIGGLIFAIILLIANRFTKVDGDFSLTPIFVAGFFGTIGLRINKDTFKKGFKPQMIFLFFSSLILVIQNILSFSVGAILKKSHVESAILGSLGIGGDHTLLNTMPFLANDIKEKSDMLMGTSVSMLYVGTIVACILYAELSQNIDLSKTVKIKEPTFNPMSFLKNLALIGITIFIGMLPTKFGFGKYINPAGGGFLVGLVLRLIIDETKIYEIEVPSINLLGNFCLSMLLVSNYAMFNLKSILSLDFYSLILIILNTIIIILIAYYVVFKVYKKNAMAAYIAAGYVGFNLGMPASTMSTIQSITEKDGAIPMVLFIVPPVGAWMVTVINPFIMKLFF